MADTNIEATATINNDGHGRSQAPRRSMTQEEEALMREGHDLMRSLARDRHMSMWDVVTLNLNSMIGNGIFSAPGVVLGLTGSKSMALTFWFVGGVYALLA